MVENDGEREKHRASLVARREDKWEGEEKGATTTYAHERHLSASFANIFASRMKSSWHEPMPERLLVRPVAVHIGKMQEDPLLECSFLYENARRFAFSLYSPVSRYAIAIFFSLITESISDKHYIRVERSRKTRTKRRTWRTTKEGPGYGRRGSQYAS